MSIVFCIITIHFYSHSYIFNNDNGKKGLRPTEAAADVKEMMQQDTALRYRQTSPVGVKTAFRLLDRVISPYCKSGYFVIRQDVVRVS